MSRNGLSAEAEELLAYVFQQGWQSPDVFANDTVIEAVRAGLIERVSIGVDEPFVILTPAGTRYCRATVPIGGFLSPDAARSAIS